MVDKHLDQEIVLTQSDTFIKDSLSNKIAGTFLGVIDGLSWFIHHSGSKLDSDNPQKKKILDRFAFFRSPVESIPYGISLDDGYRIGKFLATASSKHDEAEKDIERNALFVKNNEYWEEAKLYLKLRYTYLLLARDKKIDLKVIDNIISTESSLYQKINIISGNQEIISKAELLADYEIQLWKNHHIRDYIEFRKDAINIFTELGYDNCTANEAADAWVYSCQRHDNAEGLSRDFGKNITMPQRISVLNEWIKAGKGQGVFYRILLNAKKVK